MLGPVAGAGACVAGAAPIGAAYGALSAGVTTLIVGGTRTEAIDSMQTNYVAALAGGALGRSSAESSNEYASQMDDMYRNHHDWSDREVCPDG